MVKSPINWYGGKYYQAKKIVDLFPEHKLYCEVFGGAGHVLFKKQPSEIEVYNDLHSGLYLFFKMLRSDRREEFIAKLQLTPHSRKEFKESLNWTKEKDDFEKAKNFYIRTMQSVNSMGGWSYSKTKSRRGMSQATSKWIGKIDKDLNNAINRLKEIQIENLDFRECIQKYDTKNTLFYLDPPYVHSSRKENMAYDNEMTDKDHISLVEILIRIEGKAILSGYDNIIYQPLEDMGWNKYNLGEYSKRTTDTEKGKEIIWVNFKINKNTNSLF